MFRFHLHTKHNFYFIYFYESNPYSGEVIKGFHDDTICGVLKLSEQQYSDILLNGFNAIYDNVRRSTVFSTEQDAINAVDFLNQSYKLMSR